MFIVEDILNKLKNILKEYKLNPFIKNKLGEL